MKAIVAERGQVTIPKALRKKLGIKPGTVLEFHVKKATLVAVKVQKQDAIDRVVGCLKLNKSTDEIMRELRGDEEW
jgi:AbrB family looped-hinge helix DNA binding protein